MSKNITLEEIASLKVKDSFRAEQIRKSLGITQTFVAGCIGMPASSYNRMVRNGEQIPEKYIEPLINVLTGLTYIRQARKVLPIKNGKADNDVPKLYTDILEFLEKIQKPVIPAQSFLEDSKEACISGLLISWELEAQKLEEKILDRLND